jgi:exopolyphosphatase/guanosine-5'-triphosphate,3'-diphosphate pyrophosphatase
MATFAGIDCGTNSIRLLIVERGLDGVCRDVLRTMRVVRLGEGLDDAGVISRAALDRTFAACADYAQIIAAHDVQRVRFMATSASRDARNREDFIDGVNRLMGVRPEVITGAEEAALSFGGAIGSPVVRDASPRPRLVVDIGGGSTEFVLGEDAPSAARSVDIGCVRLAERWLRADPPAAAELAALAGDADAAIARAAAEVPLGSAASLIGVAGTVTTVAALALGLPEYDADALHGAVISADDVHRVAAELAAMTLAQRLALPVMHPGRADVIVSGALIWSRVVTAVGLPHVVVSEHDILDGIAQSAAAGR